MNKKIVSSALVTTFGVLTLLGATSAFAQSTPSENPTSTIVQKIADKFGLNKNEVQAVFDEERKAHQATMKLRMEERLNTLVTEGKITEAQKKLIVDKQEELKKNKERFKDLTPEERKSQMEAKKAELDAWATENGIDSTYLLGGFMGKGHFMKAH